VITLPLIYAFKTFADFKAKAESRRLSRSEVNEAVQRSGGLRYTRFVAQRYYEKAQKLIEELNVPKVKEDELRFLLDKAFRLI
jgi:heptaprenyl diphosphate synthase